jgi:hypothetical protein
MRAAALAATATVAVLWALVPPLPPLELLGGDAVHYAAMAETPGEPVAEAPWAQRVLVPLVAWALPFSTETSFLVLSIGSTLAAAVLVAAICRELGLPRRAQVAAAPLTAASYAGVHAVWNPYYVDPATLALVALALLLALRSRWVAFAAVLTVGVLVKEPLATLIVVPALLEPLRGVGRRRALGRAALLALPVLVAFVAVQTLAPALEPVEGDVRAELLERGVLYRGLLVSAVNPLVALFGLLLLLWPLGLLSAPRSLLRLHVWALLAFPVLALGHWERTLAVFLPLAVPAGLVALRPVAGAPFWTIVAASLWTTGVVGALTIGDGETSVAGKLALLAPGVVVGLAAAAAARGPLVEGLRGATRYATRS